MTNNLCQKYSIYSIDDIKTHYRQKTKGHWFDTDTMRFFKSRLSDKLLCDAYLFYFVSSEKNDSTCLRLYTIRTYNPVNGDIDAVGDFQDWTTSKKAWGHIKYLLKQTLTKD